jgi:hypothetical protein
MEILPVSRRALGITQPPIEWVPGALSLGIQRAGREADLSPPSGAEVKNAWRGAQLKAKGQFYLLNFKYL